MELEFQQSSAGSICISEQFLLEFRLNELSMPLLDISHSYSCFSSSVLAFRSESSAGNKLLIRYGNILELSSKDCWGGFCITKKMVKTCKLGRPEVWMKGLVINAVGILDMSVVACYSELVNGYQGALRMETDSVSLRSADLEPQSSYEDSEEVDDKERMRRMRISKANTGNTPWNKGRRHTPETIQRIKERTRLAMKDPKVKMKLVNLGHAQTEETRTKIGAGVRLGWERRREKLLLQETCLFEWQNLIAMASRKGLLGEEELQWDSHKLLSKKYEIEWVESVEQRRNNRRPKGTKRAPKSAEQKRRISESIAAKWADPEYRTRVCSGLAKFYGTPGVERKPRRKPSIDGQVHIKSPKEKDQTDIIPKRETKSQVQKIVQKRNKTPFYKDPSASSKLEMLKSIKAQRAAVTNERSEAVYRARILIAEAEKAAKSLEIAAQKSPLAYSSLMESRKLIAEAILVIESIENEDTIAPQNDNLPASDESSNNQDPCFDEKIEADASSSPVLKNGKVNGFHSITSTGDAMADEFGFNNFVLADLVNGSSSWANGATPSEEENLQKSTNGFPSLETDGTLKINNFHRDHPATERNANGKDSTNTINQSANGLGTLSEDKEMLKQEIKLVKKWVRGRLVEVAEET